MGLESLFYAFVMMIIGTVLSMIMTKKQKPSNATISETDVPTAELGKDICVVFGTILVKDSNVIDYFDPQTSEIKTDGGGKK